MSVAPIPAGYRTVTPYLIVKNAAAEIDFLQRAFGAELRSAIRGDDGGIRHAEIQIGDSMVMMGQGSEKWPASAAMIYLYVADTDDWYRRAIAAGASSVMEPTDMYYGDRNAGVQTANDIQWWIGTRIEDLSPEELERRSRAAHSGQ